MAQSQETQTPVETVEQNPHSAEQVALALKDAHEFLYKVSEDDEFQLECMDKNVDPDNDMNRPIYWDIFARRSQQLIRESRELNGDSLELRAKELLAVTPIVMFEAAALHSDKPRSSEANKRSKLAVCYYNDLIRNFALAEPATRPSDIERAINGVSNGALEHPGMRQFAAQEIKGRITGVQGELGFRQILSHTSHRFRPATPEEDLHGADVVITDEGKQPLYIDLKASLHEIPNAHDGKRPYKRISVDHIMMYGYGNVEKDFGDSFFMPDELAAARAEKIDGILLVAQKPAA